MKQTHEYEIVNPTYYKNDFECINEYAEQGWRLVSVIPAPRLNAGYTHSMVFEREIPFRPLKAIKTSDNQFHDPDDVTYVY